MDRELNEELKKLSKEAFGSSSRWRKLIDKGFPELYSRDREVMVLNRHGDLEKKVFTDHKYVLRRYTLEEVKQYMLDILERQKAFAEMSKNVPTTVTVENGVPAIDFGSEK